MIESNGQNVARKRKDAHIHANQYILANPYTIYLYDAERLLDRVKSLRKKGEKPIEPLKLELTTEGKEFNPVLDKHLENSANNIFQRDAEVHALIRSAFFLLIASFEGLLNVIYEIYLKSELRDIRIYERLSREQIDLKVLLAPMYCTCFAQETIIFSGDEFDRFRYVVNLRNDFVHANLTAHMKTAIIQEDGLTFVVEPEEAGKYGLPYSITNLTPENIEFIHQTIMDMYSAVINAMDESHQEIFVNAMKSEEIYISGRNGTFRIELPDY